MGSFVPNISFGADVVASMRKHSKLVFDCHLMVVNPERYVDAFAQAGADIMTIHAESTLHIHGALQKLKLQHESRCCYQPRNTSFSY